VSTPAAAEVSGVTIVAEESVTTVEESVEVVDSALLPQAVNTPAIAKIANNFFIVLVGFIFN
jgi:hypothetical protein